MAATIGIMRAVVLAHAHLFSGVYIHRQLGHFALRVIAHNGQQHITWLLRDVLPLQVTQNVLKHPKMAVVLRKVLTFRIGRRLK